MEKELKTRSLEPGSRTSGLVLPLISSARPKILPSFTPCISDWFYSPDVIAEATKYRLATQQQFDDWCLALDQWKSHAGALAEGEGIAFKP